MIWTAFVFGLVGSLHCLGMCGPLVMAIPQSSGIKAIAYHFSRILAYSILGAGMGLFGQGLNWAGFQQWVSIFSGVLIILFGLGLLQKKSSWPPALNRLYQRVMKGTDWGSTSLLGLLNGFLPCGMVYVALAGALSEQTVASSALYMFFFGIGTLPMMLGVSWSKNIWSRSLRNKLNRFIPVVTIIVGILFILRGLNLGIPYLSPKIENKEVKECCGGNE